MLVDLGKGWWAERSDGRVRLTLRGTVHFEWPEETWARLMADLELPEPAPAGDSSDRFHIRKSTTRAICGQVLRKGLVAVDRPDELVPGRALCFACSRGRRGR